jgi:hypothetical protein
LAPFGGAETSLATLIGELVAGFRSLYAKHSRAGWIAFGALALLGAGLFAYEEEEGGDDDDDNDDTPTPDPGGGGVTAPALPGETSATRTPVSISDMHNALSNAWDGVVGSEPTDMAVLTLMAQWHLETAGGASMYNFNVGNFKHTASNGSPAGSYMPLPTTENVNGVSTPMTLNFAAYDTLDAGVTAYLSAMHGRFGQAWPDVLTGDLDAFAQHLHDQGYYTGFPPTPQDPRTPVEKYAAGLKSRRAMIASTLGITLPASPDQSDTDDVS